MKCAIAEKAAAVQADGRPIAGAAAGMTAVCKTGRLLLCQRLLVQVIGAGSTQTAGTVVTARASLG